MTDDAMRIARLNAFLEDDDVEPNDGLPLEEPVDVAGMQAIAEQAWEASRERQLKIRQVARTRPTDRVRVVKEGLLPKTRS